MALRFGGDAAEAVFSPGRTPREVSASLGMSGLEVSSDVTPAIAESLDRACERLEVSRQSVIAFVLPSAELQAACYLTGEDTCVLVISSGLVSLLSSGPELTFVLAHELGHYLLQHGVAGNSVRELQLRRAQEISADRIGLIAAGDVHAAVRAVMKTLSGLGDEHLRPDVRAFLDTALARVLEQDGTASTHPHLSVRARCLVRFDALLRSYRDIDELIADSTALREFDRRVAGDLERFVDAPLVSRRTAAEGRLRRWSWVLAAVEDGRLSSDEQGVLQEEFGTAELSRIVSLIGGEGREGATRLVESRFNAAVLELQQLDPSSVQGFLLRELRAIEAAGRIELVRGGRLERLVKELVGDA